MAMPVPLPSRREPARLEAVPDVPRYAPLTPIARGGSATVWKAIDLRLERVVALKRLHGDLAADPIALARFEHEVASAAALVHPNVATVLDAGVDEQGPYMVLELIAGETLAELMRREAPLAPADAVRIASGVATALDHAHAAGIVHRDVKPANILVEDGTGRVVLTDFGIATSPDPVSRLTRDGQVVGTVEYMAPERAMGEPGTQAADVYSLGVIVYEMLTGSAPFVGETPLAVAIAHQIAEPPPPDALAPLPRPLAEAVLQAIAKEPAYRPVSAAAFAGDLEAALTVPAGPPRPRLRLRRLRSKATRATAAAWAAFGSMATYGLLRLVG